MREGDMQPPIYAPCHSPMAATNTKGLVRGTRRILERHWSRHPMWAGETETWALSFGSTRCMQPVPHPSLINGRGAMDAACDCACIQCSVKGPWEHAGLLCNHVFQNEQLLSSRPPKGRPYKGRCQPPSPVRRRFPSTLILNGRV